jgi:hypothetical protein
MVMTMNRGLFCVALAVLSTCVGSGAFAQEPAPTVLPISLLESFDTYGNQFETVQAYNDLNHLSFSIYDTGASVVTFSAEEQSFFPTPIPVKTPNGAVATAIGGDLIGNVSQMGTIIVGGWSAFGLDLNTFEVTIDPLNSVSVPGVQAFLGTALSPVLPTITGTPINAPSSAYPNGLATRIDTSGYELDLSSLLPGFPTIGIPDVRFMAPNSPDAVLAGTPSTYTPITIPVALLGDDNTASPGIDISVAPNPFVEGISATTLSGGAMSDKTFLFDTGAQISVISPDTAIALGLDPNDPNAPSILVQGAAGTVEVTEFFLASLDVPRSDVVGGLLHFTNVPVFVLDVGEGIDGILGMNLFNTADSIVYNPYGPGGAAISMTFLTDRDTTGQDELDSLLSDLNALFGDALGLPVRGQGQIMPHLNLVPEPSAGVMAAIALVGLLSVRRRC